MKIDKEKVAKILKSKKAMVMVMLVSILITMAFYGTAYALGYFGITTGVGLLEQWGNIFIMITICIGGYIYIVLDDTMFSKQKSKKKGTTKSKPESKIEQKVEVKKDNESVAGINIRGDNLCPECQGETEIRIRGTSRKIVCIDCGIVIKEYVTTAPEIFYGNVADPKDEL